MKLERPSLRLLTLVLSLCFAIKTQALYSVMETGDILSEGQFKANVETQFITDNDSGVNFIGRFDSWFNQDSNFRGVVGFGTTDLYLGGFYKWVPYPDMDGQPAIGVTGGLTYAKYDTDFEDIDEISIRIHPLISKRFQTEIGEMIPYASLPMGIASREGDTEFPIQAAGGVEWKTLYFKNITFNAEVGFNVNKAFSYFSLAAQIYWDEENGFQFD